MKTVRTPSPISRRPKVLASVYACQPDSGSEEGNGWNYVLQLSKFAEVWAVTRTFHKAGIERALRSIDLPNVHWHYYDFRWPDAWHRMKRFERLHYNAWQALMFRNLAEPLDDQVHFDVSHHLTWAQYWSASQLYRLPAKFVWGPVGGGESAPDSFWPTFSLKGKVYEAVRDCARKIGNMRPSVRNQAMYSSIALAATPESAAEMRRLGATNVSLLSNAALPLKEFERLSALENHTSDKFRVISIGRLLNWKGFHLGLYAFARFLEKVPDAEYWIIGTGPESVRLHKLAAKLGISRSVHFWGLIPRDEVLQKLLQCSVLMHPSLHDSAGWVVLEAGASGLPVVCLDIGGPSQLVTNSTGIKISAVTPEQACEDLSKALSMLALDPDLRDRMSRAGRQHIKDNYLWDCVGEYFRTLPAYQIGTPQQWLDQQQDEPPAEVKV